MGRQYRWKPYTLRKDPDLALPPPPLARRILPSSASSVISVRTRDLRRFIWRRLKGLTLRSLPPSIWPAFLRSTIARGGLRKDAPPPPTPPFGLSFGSFDPEIELISPHPTALAALIRCLLDAEIGILSRHYSARKHARRGCSSRGPRSPCINYAGAVAPQCNLRRKEGRKEGGELTPAFKLI